MEWAHQDFKELVSILEANPSFNLEMLLRMSESADNFTARNGFILQTAWHYREGQYDEALLVLDKAETRFPLLPVSLFILRFKLRFLTGHSEKVPMDYLAYGYKALDQGQLDLGLESVGAAFVNDINMALELIHNPSLVKQAAEKYEQVAKQLANRVQDALEPVKKDKLKMGMIVPNLVDDTVAYSRRVMYFAKFVDRARFDLRVYSTENMCLRRHELPILYVSQPSEERAKEFLKKLKALDVPVYLATREKTITETVMEVVEKMAEDGIDIVLLQAGVAMPIDWLATHLVQAPVKMQIHIGVSAYQRGMDATLFDNAVNMTRESESWPDYAGRQILMRRGTDIQAMDSIKPLERAPAGFPENAALIGVMSNHLDARLSDEYIDVISDVLRSNAKAWFVGIGPGDCSGRILNRFRQKGVSDRVRFLPQQREPGAVLKMLDIYANEFPVGGSQSVVEAMVCGLPVVAMRCADTHHESVGADIVGPPFAVESNNPEAYRETLDRWVRDRSLRREIGDKMRERATREFSIQDYVRRVCDLGWEYYIGKTP